MFTRYLKNLPHHACHREVLMGTISMVGMLHIGYRDTIIYCEDYGSLEPFMLISEATWKDEWKRFSQKLFVIGNYMVNLNDTIKLTTKILLCWHDGGCSLHECRVLLILVSKCMKASIVWLLYHIVSTINAMLFLYNREKIDGMT
jgi:hypothetical protein